MSVQEALGYTADQIAAITQREWPAWSARLPELAAADPSDVRRWLLASDWRVADPVLLALARLADVDEFNDTHAAAVLAWSMLPVASGVAGAYASCSVDIDHEVAAQLWLAVRTFPWRTSRSVVFHIRRTLRRALYREFAKPQRDIPMSSEILQLVFDDRTRTTGPNSVDELSALLTEALRSKLIDAGELQLLMALLDAAHDLRPGETKAAAVLGERVSTHVAAGMDCTARTVRRRARRSLEALASLEQERERSRRPRFGHDVGRPGAA